MYSNMLIPIKTGKKSGLSRILEGMLASRLAISPVTHLNVESCGRRTQSTGTNDKTTAMIVKVLHTAYCSFEMHLLCLNKGQISEIYHCYLS